MNVGIKFTTWLFTVICAMMLLSTGCKECRICSARVDIYYIRTEGNAQDTVGRSFDIFPNKEICGSELEEPIYQDAIVEEFDVSATLKEVRVKYYTCR